MKIGKNELISVIQSTEPFIKPKIELEQYFVVTPAFQGIYRNIDYAYPGVKSRNISNPYNSANETPLSILQLQIFLRDNNLLYEDPRDTKHPDERYFPNGI